MYDDIYHSYYEFYHHGIKGQKWGVRRYQKKDGTLTPAGKKRYSDNYTTHKEDRYNKLYDKYKTLGYSDEKARQSAIGQLKSEKALKIIGGVAIAAVVAYGAYRYYDTTADKIIKPGQHMQTVHIGDVTERIKPNNPFYASYTKKDNVIYASKVFSHFGKDSNVTKMYTKDGIKVASEKSGRKIFDELCKTNPEVAAYSKRIGHFGEGRKAYERFNYSLVFRNNSDSAKQMRLGDLNHDKIHNIFYDELKKRGYGAVIDVNDSRREGFTFKPVIVFDNQIKHIVGTTKANESQLQGEQFLKGARYSFQRKQVLNPAKSPAVLLSGYMYACSLGYTNKMDKELNRQVQFVEEYLKKHPNTKLTNDKILKLYNSA